MLQTISFGSKSRHAYLAATFGSLLASVVQWLLQPLIGGMAPFFLVPVVLFLGMRFGRIAGFIAIAIGFVNLAILISPVGGHELSQGAGIAILSLYLVLAFGSSVVGGRLRLVTIRAADTERRLLLAQENTGMGVFELDHAAGTAYLSAGLCSLLGRPVVDGPIPLKDWLDSLDQQHREESARAISERLARGELQYEREISAILPDGQIRWLLSRITLETAPDGSLARAYGATVDITERKLLDERLNAAQVALEEQRKLENDRLVEADQRKDDFLATLAHELRSPLAPIRHAAAILESAGVDDIRRRKSLQIIERQVKRMALLLEDLLDVSRVSHGTVQIRRHPTSLYAVIDAAIETTKPLRDDKHQDLGLNRPGVDLGINVDSLRMSQVVSNLLSNASKYSDEGSTIGLDVTIDDQDLSIKVRDTGIGLAKDQIERIFDMFVQAPDGLTRSQGGLGIGLSLARNLVELHDGQLTANSQGIGCGSVFEVFLPDVICCAPDLAAANTEVMACKPTARDFATDILVADDNVDSAESLGELLRLAGHNVYVAYDGAQALEIYSRVKPWLVLLDVGMPNMSGLDVARSIRAMQDGADATLIAISGWGQALDRQNALQSGFDQHITKPIDSVALHAIIEATQNGRSGLPSFRASATPTTGPGLLLA